MLVARAVGCKNYFSLFVGFIIPYIGPFLNPFFLPKYVLEDFFMSGIVKVYKQENPFEMIPRTTLQDSSISLQALGLLVNVCSYPDTWQIYKTELYKRFDKNKETSVRNAWKELIEAGYVMEKKYRNGRKWEYEYAIRTTPFTEEEKSSFEGTNEDEKGEDDHFLRTGFSRPQNEDPKMKTSKPRGNIYNHKENTHKENTHEYITHLSISEEQKTFLLKYADEIKPNHLKAYEELDGLIDDKYLLNSKFLDCVQKKNVKNFKSYFKKALDDAQKETPKQPREEKKPEWIGSTDESKQEMGEEELKRLQESKNEMLNIWNDIKNGSAPERKIR